jgi:spoIIIJ-associated protein
MSEYQEFTGKSVEEALRSATEAFGVSGLQDLDFEILAQGSRGVLGMGAEPARIIAAPRSSLGGDAPRHEATAAAPASSPPAEPDPEPARAGVTEEAAADDAPPDAARADDAPTTDEAHPADAPPKQRRSSERRRSSPGRSRGSGESRGASSSEVPAEVVIQATAARQGPDEAEVSPEALEAGKEILEHLVELMGYDATVEATAGPTAKIGVFGANDEEKEALGALIGRKGERLSALQHLINLMLSRKMGSWTRVLVDVEDYRGRRERQLAEVAIRAAERVQETGQMLQLEPMSALERRWVHISLRDVEGVSTQSIGEEPMRRVVVLKA